MPTQGWITTPQGKRWRNPGGQLSYMPPASAGLPAQLTASIGNGLLGAVDVLNRSGIGISSAARAEYLGSGARSLASRDPRIHNAPTSASDLAALRGAQNAAIRAYGPGQGAPIAHVTPPERARQEAVTAMAQQYAPQDYWKTQTGAALSEAAKTGPRAGESGYAQRADIAAWIDANKNAPKGVDGKNIVDRFLEKQRAQGLLDAPAAGATLASERLQMPVDTESAAQATQRGLRGFDGSALEQAQADVARLQQGERADLAARAFQGKVVVPGTEAIAAALPTAAAPWPSDAQLSSTVAFGPGAAQPGSGLAEAIGLRPGGGGIELAQRPVEAPQAREQAMQAVQPAQPAQAASTGGTDDSMQPLSAAASQVGVAPAVSEAPGNAPNPADELLNRHLQLSRSRLIGY